MQLSLKTLILAALTLCAASVCSAAEERQLTFGDSYSHPLDNNDNFSPDDRFLVFAASGPDRIADAKFVAKVKIATGKIDVLYEPKNQGPLGPAVKSASFAHQSDQVIFVHGPLNPTGGDNRYETYCRLGAIVNRDGSLVFCDARNLVEPFTAGALRGGTHRHEFSLDGQWVGFTYNDAVMRTHGLTIGKDLDLRTIGVTRFGTPVRVPANEYFTDRGEGFSVVVVTVTVDPEPGSDEISHAYSDSWVGHHGYKRPDGTRQRARTFLGRTVTKDGRHVEELFIVDIPDDITVPGPLGPLQGTKTTFPMPPAGTRQRRLTHTENSVFPGCQGIVRCSPDGDQILFRMKDGKNRSQLFLTTPYGETPKQITFVDGGITDNARWNPSRNVIASVSGNKILITNVEPGPRFGQTRVLIDKAPPPYALVWSHDGKTLAYNRAIKTNDKEVRQIFVTTFDEQ